MTSRDILLCHPIALSCPADYIEIEIGVHPDRYRPVEQMTIEYVLPWADRRVSFFLIGAFLGKCHRRPVYMIEHHPDGTSSLVERSAGIPSGIGDGTIDLVFGLPGISEALANTAAWIHDQWPNGMIDLKP